MKRWNGWGDESMSMALPSSVDVFLQQTVGVGNKLTDISLADAVNCVPRSKLEGSLEGNSHPLISTDAEQRLRHARGHSLPDYIAMRTGDIKHFPDGVCFPENRQQVKELLQYAKQYNIELIPYGGGTSVAGHINPKADSSLAIVTVDMTHMNQLLDLDEESQIATFGAGTLGPMVEAQLRAKGYTLGHYPQSFELSSIGGWIASRSSGQQSLRYGRIEQLFAGGNIETFAGSLELPAFPASSAGPDLRELILGSEGRFGILTEVKVRVTKLAEHEQFSVLFFPSWQQAKSFCRMTVQNHIQLSMLRVSNAIETQTQLKLAGHEKAIYWLEKYLNFRGCAQGKCMLTFGITGSNKQVKQVKSLLKPWVNKYRGTSAGAMLGKKWQENRFRSPYLRDALWQKGYVVDTLETATNWSNVDNLMQEVEQTLSTTLAATEQVHVFTHLSHVYKQGCSLYTTYVYKNGKDHHETLANWQQLKHAASEAIVHHGGTISHQHGVGKDHAPYLAIEKGEQGMHLLHALSAHFDEKKLLNPGTLLND
jgi:alkyldihydroxyacetonephosphate synthase